MSSTKTIHSFKVNQAESLLAQKKRVKMKGKKSKRKHKKVRKKDKKRSSKIAK